MMFSEIVCREWNSIRVRFWSIGYKKRLALLVILLLVLVCFLVWSSLMVDLSDLKFADGKGDGVNDGSVWDKWVIANGLRAIGDIYDNCDHNGVRKKIGKIVIHYDPTERRVIGTAVANFTAKVNLNGGVVHVVAQFQGRTLYDVKHNVCKLEATSFGCPMHEGQELSIYEPFKLPKYIPKGNYFASAKLLNEEGICLGMTESNLNL